MKQKNIPVKLNEMYDVLIESQGSKGDGIAKINGFVVIVPEAKVNDTLRIRIQRILPNVAFGKIVQISEDW